MYEIYNIKLNDTIESIAKEFNTTKDELSKINGFSFNYNIIPNTNIIVPTNQNKPYKYYTIKKGDTIYQISEDNNIDYNLLLKINGLDEEDYIYPNQTILIPNNSFTLYLTKKNDTIEEISNKLNITPNLLIEENPNMVLETDQIIIFKEK